MHNLFVSQLRKAKVRRGVGPPVDGNDGEVALPATQENRLQWSVENLSYAEVARVLAIPIGTVMSRLARGRERLRQLTGREARPVLRPVLRRVQ